LLVSANLLYNLTSVFGKKRYDEDLTKLLTEKLILGGYIKEAVSLVEINNNLDDYLFGLIDREFEHLLLSENQETIINELSRINGMLEKFLDMSDFVERVGIDMAMRIAALTHKEEKFWEMHQAQIFLNAKRLIDDGELEKALTHYHNLSAIADTHSLSLPKKQKETVSLLTKAYDKIKRGDYFYYPIELRDSKKSGSINVKIAESGFNSCYKKEGDPVVKMKCLFLQARANKRLGRYNKASTLFSTYIQRYPKSELVDDAYAELGLLNLEVGNINAAKRNFAIAYSKYSGKNAADNALNWLGDYYYSTGETSKAYLYYSKVVKEYAENRLASVAKNMLGTIFDDMYGKGNRVFIKGVALVSYNPMTQKLEVAEVVDKDSQFQEGDQIIEIDGYQLLDLNSYIELTTELLSVNSKIHVSVKREDKKVDIRTTLLPNAFGRKLKYL
jgi:TolA-binding protein